ncbi:MAG TPA: glycosyltransferase family 39 protein [Blastocatellia bacterium]|nr:glycosyltransferase family 39 protein [Blastocatellia bacterium]
MSNTEINFATGQGRSWRLEQIVSLAITVVAGAVVYGIFVRRGIWLSVIGYSVSPAERVLEGEVPYRDFLYNYTPGTLWVNALLMKVFGATLITVNYGLLAFKLATLVAVYWLGRRLVSHWAALIPVALTLAWLGHKYIYGVVPTQYSMLFVLLGLNFMLSFDKGSGRRWLFLSGVSVGLVLVFKYNVGVALLGTGTLIVAIREVIQQSGDEIPFLRRVIAATRVAAFYWAGFAVVAGALAIYLAQQGALAPMISHFLRHAGEYSEVRAVGLPRPHLVAPAVVAGALAAVFGLVMLHKASRWFELYLILLLAIGSALMLVPGRAYAIKVSGTSLVAYSPLLLFAIAGLMAFRQFRHSAHDRASAKESWRRIAPGVVVTSFALGAYLEMYPRADQYHLVRLLPVIFLLALLLIARSVPALAAYLQRRLQSPGRAALLCASVPLTFLLAVGVKDTWQPQFDSSLQFIDRTPVALDRAEGILVSRKQAEFINGLTKIITDNSAAGDYIFSFAQRGTGLYFLTDRRNPTRFVWWRSVGLEERDRQLVLDKIAERTPKLVLLQDSLRDVRIRERVTSNYDHIGNVADIGVFNRR